MKHITELTELIKKGHADGQLLKLYKKEHLSAQKERYLKLLKSHQKLFGNKEIMIISAPGRTELGGNHVDHNNGNVLAGSVEFDSVCIVSKTKDNNISFFSEGFDSFCLDVLDLSFRPQEKETTIALLRGVLFYFKDFNYKIGGFNCNMDSKVLPGAGLSSSASLEVMIGTLLSELFNNGKVNYIDVAKIGQLAENNYFGKASGLMDQISCAAGGIVGIDFKDPSNIVVKPVDVNFIKNGYTLMITDVKSSHANLSDEYSAIPAEMKYIAEALGKDVCREISLDELEKNIQRLRSHCGDRAVLRAFHFINETKRADYQLAALESGKIKEYLKLVKDSGDSSFKYLQNIYTNSNPQDQAISIGLAFTEDFLKKVDPSGVCACRVQGGGFAGTIQAYVPNNRVEDYKKLMNNIFGEGSCFELKIRKVPACRIL